MEKALHDSLSAGERGGVGFEQIKRTGATDWRKKISDHVAFALLVYTGLHIFVTAHALKGEPGTILPYFALVVLVGAVIPACRMVERRWDGLSDTEAADPALRGAFYRDVGLLWLAAISLPLLLTAAFKAIAAVV